jgi:hypothetical protein
VSSWNGRKPALLSAQLPQLYMATFFTRGVETASELRISLRRLDAFLALPEPPPPSHLSAAGGAAQVGPMASRVYTGIALWHWGCQHPNRT